MTETGVPVDPLGRFMAPKAGGLFQKVKKKKEKGKKRSKSKNNLHYEFPSLRGSVWMEVNFFVVLPGAEVNPGSHSGFPEIERKTWR